MIDRIPIGFLTIASALLILVLASVESSAQLTVGPNVNASRLAGNHQEVAIAIDPTNSNRLFTFSNTEVASGGLFAAFSTDGGATWTYTDTGDGIIADAGDALPAACCDPSAAWDQFGNLFISYLDNNFTTGPQVRVALSVDGGQNFTLIGTLGNDTDFPTIATGSGSVWITYKEFGQAGTPIVAHGAAVTGLNAVGGFGAAQAAPGSAGGNFGGIAVGPGGEVLVTYQSPSGGQGPNTIFVNLDADNLGAGGFGAAVSATTTNVGGFDFIPAQPDRSVPAGAFLSYDQTGGVHDGRVYLVYSDETPDESDDLDTLVRFSDDNGANWSGPVQANDDATTNSQFMPRIAVDQATGWVAVSWHGCRNDDGLGGPGDNDGTPNNDAQFFATVSLDGGVTFLSNVQVSAGTSDEDGSEPPGGGFADLDYGDYTGLAFFDGSFYPAWADNSNSTGDNPDGTLNNMDIYTARIDVNEPPICDANGPYVAECQGVTTSVSLDGTGSNDPEGEDLAYSWTTDCPDGSFDDPTSPMPELTVDTSPGCDVICNVSLTVTDTAGASDTCMTSIIISDTLAPDLTCPADKTIECDESTDPTNTGNPTVTDMCDPIPMVSFSDTIIPGTCPEEFTITRTWTAIDECGNLSSCDQVITVVDTTAPIISSMSVSPEVLWPPNHKMRPVTVEVDALDNCDPKPGCKVTSVSSNEPVDGLGDGNTAPDWEITGDLTVNLRAERSGNGNGRVYTLTVECTDACGNSSTRTTEVTVPHDKGK